MKRKLPEICINWFVEIVASNLTNSGHVKNSPLLTREKMTESSSRTRAKTSSASTMSAASAVPQTNLTPGTAAEPTKRITKSEST